MPKKCDKRCKMPQNKAEFHKDLNQRATDKSGNDLPVIPDQWHQTYRDYMGDDKTMSKFEALTFRGRIDEAVRSVMNSGPRDIKTELTSLAIQMYFSIIVIATNGEKFFETKDEACPDEEDKLKKSMKNEKALANEFKVLQKKLDNAQDKIAKLEFVQHSLKNEKKRSEAVQAKMDTNQVGKIKAELDSLKKTSDDQKKTIQSQNLIITSLKKEISSQNESISELKRESRGKTRLMKYGFAGDETQSRQVALSKMEMEELQKELASEEVKEQNWNNLELFLSSNAKKKDKIAAKKYYEKQMLEREVIMRKVQENLNKIDKFYSFSTSQLVPVSNNEVFTESTRRSIEHLLKYIGSDSSMVSGLSVDEEECPICMEAVTSSVDDLEKCPQCKKESHTTCIGEWLEKEGTCPFCRHIISEPTRNGARQ